VKSGGSRGGIGEERERQAKEESRRRREEREQKILTRIGIATTPIGTLKLVQIC